MTSEASGDEKPLRRKRNRRSSNKGINQHLVDEQEEAIMEDLIDYFFAKLRRKNTELIDEDALRYNLSQLELLEDDEDQAKKMIQQFGCNGTIDRAGLKEAFIKCKINYKSYL